MKNIRTLLPVIAIFISATLFAQNRIKKPDQDKIKAYKIAYITDQLNLTSEEAQKFWPIYNEHEKKLAQFRKEENSSIRKLIKNRDLIDQVSESDAQELVISVASIQNKTHVTNQEYLKKLKKILPYKKILKLQIAEREFKRKLFENLRSRRKKFRGKRE